MVEIAILNITVQLLFFALVVETIINVALIIVSTIIFIRQR